MTCENCGQALNRAGLCPSCDYCPTCGALMEAADGTLVCMVCLAREDGESAEDIAALEKMWPASVG